MMDNKEYDFLKFYIEQTNNEMRHTEVLRERVTYFVLILMSVILGFIVQNDFGRNTLIVAYALIFIGIIGSLMVRKLYMLHQFEQHRVNEWYKLLQKNYNVDELFEYRKKADNLTKNRFFIFSKIPHNWFWFIFNNLPILVGVYCALKICEIL